MLSRIATVLQELSGEEATDGDQQGTLVPQLPAAEGQAVFDTEVPEDAMERLVHLEQLVVQLKELIREKDTQLMQKDTELTNKDAQLKTEKEEAEARFTKLKLQAKAKMASLNKQITELKGQAGTTQSPDSSFTGAGSAVEEELEELRSKLSVEEAKNRELQERLQATEQLLQEEEAAHAEQLKVLQTVVKEKDVRFQEQVQKHEEELLRVTTQVQDDFDRQQVLLAAQQRCKELEDALNTRSEELVMLQEELNSADQQKQILTGQFRQMEQELKEAATLRAELLGSSDEERSALKASLENVQREKLDLQRQLVELREAELVHQDVLEEKKQQVATLEAELALVKEAHDEASEQSRVEITRLENELEQTRQDRSDGEKMEEDQVEKEREDMQKKNDILVEMWRILHGEEIPACTDLCLLLDSVQSVQTQLTSLQEQCSQQSQQCAELTQNMETLQEQLDIKTAEQENATARIQQLEQQIVSMSDRTEEPEQDSSEAEKAQIQTLKQELFEKENELTQLRESLLPATKHSSGEAASKGNLAQTPNQDLHASSFPTEAAVAPSDSTEDAQEEETTLVAEDTSVISISADESSPELIRHQSDSPEESKGTSSDEMITSTDSEVAHSSWTLLEAVNQDGGQDGSQDWPSIPQDVSHSWVAPGMEQEASPAQTDSSPVIQGETVESHLAEHQSSSAETSSDLFAQALAEELQKRYGELLAELQWLKEATVESQERIKSLEQETWSLTAAKDDAEARAVKFAKELESAKESIQEKSLMEEKHGAEMQLLEEQVDILSSRHEAKEQEMQALQADLELAHKAVSEQENTVKLLSSQLEDREVLTSDLHRRLQEMENGMLEISKASVINTDALTEKDSLIKELQLLLSQKEQEVMELNASTSHKLLKADEEKFQIKNEIDKLKEQIVGLEKVKEENQVDVSEPADHVEDELLSLRREKEELETQLANLKKKLQAALVQRKELMKKVNDFEREAENWKEKHDTEKEEKEKSKAHESQEMEEKLLALQEALRSREEAVETLERKLGQQDHGLSETLAFKRKLSEESDVSIETAALRSHVASLEAECETLQKKVQEAQESRKETIRKAQEKDRHHRDQMKQQKVEYNELLERYETQSGERDILLTQIKELDGKMSSNKEDRTNIIAKSAAGDWVQEDWVDFVSSDTDSSQQQSKDPKEQPAEETTEDESLTALKDEIQALGLANTELQKQLQEAHAGLSLKESELIEHVKELQELREKVKLIDALSEEIRDLREKHQQAEAHAETLKLEMEAAVKDSSESSITALQAEVEDFKLFLDKKNCEMAELSHQLSQQNVLIHSMQEAVSQKDQHISSLQDALEAEREKALKFEAELQQKPDEDGEAKMQQLQRKLQAALVSRKEALKENKTLKEQLATAEQVRTELQEKITSAEQEVEKLRTERLKLIEEVDRTLLENQSLGSSCESLKLLMEGIINEKDVCKKEADFAKEEASRMCREWEEKVQGMKEEYETLLRSYENVSDEAERVRKVLEAARQERQELAVKVRGHESARQEAERRAEEAQKEVDSVKDKMRKFAKTKQQKILELEEENERLRELQSEKSAPKQEETAQEGEAKLQEEIRALKAELEASTAEKDSLILQIEEIKEKLAEMEEAKKELSERPTPVEVLTVQQRNTSMTSVEPIQSEHGGKGADVEEKEEMKRSEELQILLDNKMKEVEALTAEKELWQRREAELEGRLGSLEGDLHESKNTQNNLDSLEQSLQESRDRERGLIEDGLKRESQFKELLKSLEAEKDNLEERLMNQLAQLNGSIAGYQQEASDSRERITELQREAERLERQRAELESEARSERERAARLEEDMRQAQRERAEAEAESGKQRELEQQLRSAQRVKEGSQSRARQLEELLREKQLEVRQLQKDSIQYQEKISELCRESKALQMVHRELQGTLEHSQLEGSRTLEELRRTEEEIENWKSDLSEAQREAKEALAAKASLENSIQQREAALKAEAEQTLDSVRFKLGAELKEMELRLEEADAERERLEETTIEAREEAESAERRAQETQARLDESLARLAAFSRCMSSLQDDRDRVLDEARQWESRFNSALQGKEAEVREAETQAKELSDALQKEIAVKEELKLSLTRLQKADEDLRQRLEEEEKKVADLQAALELQNEKLEKSTAEMFSAQNQVDSLRSDLESQHQRTRALEEGLSRLQEEADQARTEQREREAEERRLCLNVEQLETDLRSSKALMESLQTELHEKEKREVELLGEKEQAVAQAAEEAKKEAESRAEEAEQELEQKRGEVRDLENKLRKAEEEANNRKTKLDSFMNAMGSLQDDRDRVLNMYKQLEQKHLQVMMEKDGLIQEAAQENNGLKEELRSLLVQRDDLYAEKAKLSAQLHGYRDELNHVLSMKDSQHKQLLAAQRDRIASLERERDEMEHRLKSLNKEEEVVQRVESETLSRAAPVAPPSQVTAAPGAEVEKLMEQLQVERGRVAALEESLLRERQEFQSRSKELDELRWEGGVMRTESESAQERVAELARDLLTVEQRLLVETETTKQLRAQNEAFAKAMASLQDSKDQAESRSKELSLKVEELSRTGGQAAPSGAAGEVWGLKNALQALQNDRDRLLEQLGKQAAELRTQKSDLARLGAGELIKVSQELLEQKKRNEDLLEVMTQLETDVETGKQETSALRLERMDWMAQAEQLKQQTLATLSEKDSQLRQLAGLLEEARAHKPKVQQLQRESADLVNSAPGAPQERRSVLEGHAHISEVKDLQQRLEKETRQRLAVEEQLMVTQDQLKRQGTWHSSLGEDSSETAVFMEPPEGSVTRTRRGGPGLMRMLRVALCSRQRTPLLLSLYLLTVHVLLLLCLGGFL